MATEPATTLDPAARACLERTRGAVLNVLVADGLAIALSGVVLRWRAGSTVVPGSKATGKALLGALLAVTIASYVVRRTFAARGRLRDPARRAARFHRAGLLSAGLGSLAIPLGLAYGWLVQPELGAVAPFWVAGLALGFLALPRAIELEDFPAPRAPAPDPEPPA